MDATNISMANNIITKRGLVNEKELVEKTGSGIKGKMNLRTAYTERIEGTPKIKAVLR